MWSTQYGAPLVRRVPTGRMMTKPCWSARSASRRTGAATRPRAVCWQWGYEHPMGAGAVMTPPGVGGAAGMQGGPGGAFGRESEIADVPTIAASEPHVLREAPGLVPGQVDAHPRRHRSMSMAWSVYRSLTAAVTLRGTVTQQSNPGVPGARGEQSIRVRAVLSEGPAASVGSYWRRPAEMTASAACTWTVIDSS